MKRREAKSKGEKERYTHLNAEFQRIARRDKKAFLSDQCKEIEVNNRMGKTRDLFKKIRDTKGTFHVKVVIRFQKNWKTWSTGPSVDTARTHRPFRAAMARANNCIQAEPAGPHFFFVSVLCLSSTR